MVPDNYQVRCDHFGELRKEIWKIAKKYVNTNTIISSEGHGIRWWFNTLINSKFYCGKVVNEIWQLCFNEVQCGLNPMSKCKKCIIFKKFFATTYFFFKNTDTKFTSFLYINILTPKRNNLVVFFLDIPTNLTSNNYKWYYNLW